MNVQEEERTKYCPLPAVSRGIVEYSGDEYAEVEFRGCLRDECMWFIEGKCAVVVIAESLGRVRK
ncbi:hypothetical protein [Candidatus Methanodesulfokora washburnensis]|jgi:hypothetical protein|uniref:Uncharacterized protein n=1 Tax=Candidatus Methanodesulfokora washburnensis TaxID=2478471 RepID=A0A429GFI2_9CREN|nr:hypothetical protein [Candidatus Methanodesulfokores washburnensis]RSN72638.1 hypothetical protein D6D85_12970 [Candidatus Methanodesulfokores washburnensis]